jgi:carbon monoxide dehydrogenase subunit G
MKLSYKIKKSSDLVFNYLTDMQKLVSVHPVITRIEPTGNETYLVYETLKWGFIPISFNYPVTIDSWPQDNLVIMRATVLKMVKIEMTFMLKMENSFTIIEENVKFRSPLPIKSVMKSIFKKQHKQLFHNIESL